MTEDEYSSNPLLRWLNEDPFATPPEPWDFKKMMYRACHQEDEEAEDELTKFVDYPPLKSKLKTYAHNPQECGDYCCHYLADDSHWHD